MTTEEKLFKHEMAIGYIYMEINSIADRYSQIKDLHTELKTNAAKIALYLHNTDDKDEVRKIIFPPGTHRGYIDELSKINAQQISKPEESENEDD
jgi:hypothetical protein